MESLSVICSSSLDQLPAFGINRVAVGCGVFDGLHLGHQEIIDTVLKTAQSSNAVPVVITFDPHPEIVLNPRCAPKLLLSKKHQLHLFQKFHIGAVVVLPFTKNLAVVPPEEFIKRIIFVEGLQVTTFCVGKAWRFGYRAGGDIDLLKKMGSLYNFGVHPVPEMLFKEAPISSTRVRAALSKGDLKLVTNLLGRNFSILGTVEFGKGIATSDLKYPTANISSNHEACPPFGVYAAKVHLFQNKECTLTKDGILYLGESPTFVDMPPEKPFIEIHIFDFHRDIYGQTIEVEVIEFLRGDQKFDAIESLRDQIAEDIFKVKKLLRAKKSSQTLYS